VQSADVCTDPECFKTKTEAQAERLAAAARKDGREVITGKEARKIVPEWGEQLTGGYTSLAEKIYTGAGKLQSVKAILGKDLPPVALIQHPKSGELIEAVRTKDAEPMLRKARGSSRSSVKKTAAQIARERSARQKERLEQESRRAIYFAARAKASTSGLGLEDLRIVAGSYWERLWHDYRKIIAEWWIPDEQGKKKLGAHERINRVSKLVAGMKGSELISLLLDCALAYAVAQGDRGFGRHGFGSVELLARRHGLDVARIRRATAKAADQAKASTSTKKPAPAKTKAKASKKKPAKKTI
jgi:hypothetical protein